MRQRLNLARIKCCRPGRRRTMFPESAFPESARAPDRRDTRDGLAMSSSGNLSGRTCPRGGDCALAPRNRSRSTMAIFNGHLCCPKSAPIRAVHGAAPLVDLGTCLRVVDHLREHALMVLHFHKQAVNEDFAKGALTTNECAAGSGGFVSRLIIPAYAAGFRGRVRFPIAPRPA